MHPKAGERTHGDLLSATQQNAISIKQSIVKIEKPWQCKFSIVLPVLEKDTMPAGIGQIFYDSQ